MCHLLRHIDGAGASDSCWRLHVEAGGSVHQGGAETIPRGAVPPLQLVSQERALLQAHQFGGLGIVCGAYPKIKASTFGQKTSLASHAMTLSMSQHQLNQTTPAMTWQCTVSLVHGIETAMSAVRSHESMYQARGLAIYVDFAGLSAARAFTAHGQQNSH